MPLPSFICTLLNNLCLEKIYLTPIKKKLSYTSKKIYLHLCQRTRATADKFGEEGHKYFIGRKSGYRLLHVYSYPLPSLRCEIRLILKNEIGRQTQHTSIISWQSRHFGRMGGENRDKAATNNCSRKRGGILQWCGGWTTTQVEYGYFRVSFVTTPI
jgi:hypothetical protein